MKRSLSQFLADYGMIFVLLLLCALFSVATYREQNPTGEAAAKQLGAELNRQPGKGGRVMIAVRNQADDAVFARKLEQELTAGGVEVAARVSGEPLLSWEAVMTPPMPASRPLAT